jgi:DNA-binding CsgD family transcriptional regulator
VLIIPPHIHFTPCEKVVVENRVNGCSNADIAAIMGNSTETVKRHLSNIMDKVGMSTSLELACYFHRLEVDELRARIAALQGTPSASRLALLHELSRRATGLAEAIAELLP